MLKEVFISFSGTARTLPMHFEVAMLEAEWIMSLLLLMKGSG